MSDAARKSVHCCPAGDSGGAMSDEIEDWDGCEDEPEYCFECNNMGIIPCECGGDICVCLNNGEMPCPYCDR